VLKTPLDVVDLVRLIFLVLTVETDFDLNCEHHNLCFNLISLQGNAHYVIILRVLLYILYILFTFLYINVLLLTNTYLY